NPLAVMNERGLTDPKPARKLNPEISPQLQEILQRALERDRRHRYPTALEMAWGLEHQDLVGGEEGAPGPPLHKRIFPGGRKMLLYACLALVPILIFGLMVMLARR